MDLLKSSELPAWLLERYGSASVLAKALGTTRQTAHNLMTGRTIPSYETCKKLGLEPMFMQMLTRSSDEMDTLEDFLLKRSSQASKLEAEQAKVRLLNERASGAWTD